MPAHDKLQAVLGRALSADRDKRYGSAQEFLVALEEYAIAERMMGSQLKFASFLSDHFGSEMIALRRERELSVREMPSELPPLPPPTQEPEPESDSGSRWREPGAATRDPIISDHSELGHFDSMPDFSSSEVEDTLARLEREQVTRDERRPSRISLPPPKILNDWLWYAAAVAILLLGVIGYLVS